MKKALLAVALIATIFTCSYAASIEDITKDTLINSGSHTLSGTFGAYDFDPKGDKNKFDWAFTTSNGKTYQLRGNNPTPDNVFGWAAKDIATPPEPAWYMFQVDVDGDGLGRFDWILLSAKGAYATKLDGVADSGSFEYTGKINIDYEVSGTSVSTGAKGTLNGASNTKSCTVEFAEYATAFSLCGNSPVSGECDEVGGILHNETCSQLGYTYVTTATSEDESYLYAKSKSTANSIDNCSIPLGKECDDTQNEASDIVGAWTDEDRDSTLIFFSDGFYSKSEVGPDELETGKYTWNPNTGDFNVPQIYSDTNSNSGLNGTEDTVFSVTISNDSLTFKSPDGEYTGIFSRVE